MKNDLKLELEKQCEEAIDEFKKYYPKQIKYNGVLKDIYERISDLRRKNQNNESLKEVSFNGCVRLFVDDTMDYSNPIIKKIERIEELLNKL